MRTRLIIVATLLVTGHAHAKREPRTTVTVEVSLGAGAYRYSRVNGDETAVALTGGGSVGAFVAPNLAVMYHAVSAIALREQFVSTALHGAVMQWWPSESFFVSAGPGVAVHSPQGLFPSTDHPYGETRIGFGGSLRVGWAFENSGHSSWHLSAEAVPVFVGSSRALFGALQLEWQYL